MNITMIIKGEIVDPELVAIKKSIANNLENKDLFQSTNKDTADSTTELKPPIPMESCLYVFQHSSHVAKCCRILADDIIYNDITLTLNSIDEPPENLVNQVKKINEFINENIDELHNMAIDYYYASWAVMEYTWNNVRFKLKQIPVHSCKVIRTTVQDMEVYLLKQQINNKTSFYKIMGEDYPEDFLYYNNMKLGYVSLIGGDNIYQFFGLPRWIQNYDEILTEIAIRKSDYKTVANGNISSGVLNINLEPQLPKPIEYDEEGNPKPIKSRQQVISKELQSANGGTAVIFTESNRPLNMDYVSLTNNNHSYLAEVGTKCEQAVLNDYNVPKVRLMINTDKESMNSDKTKSIWQIYNLNLMNEQKPFKIFIKELVEELYSLDVNVEITTPIFSDMREVEVKLINDAWMNGALTLKQYITGLSEYISVIDLNEYDFTVNPDLWSFRKIPELQETMSVEDEELIRNIEAQLSGL